MSLKAEFRAYTLNFKRPSGTSRGVLKTKDTWFIRIWDSENPDCIGVGECGMFRGLSFDDRPDFEEKLQEVCDKVNDFEAWLSGKLKEFPAIHFGLEQAILDLKNGGKSIFYPTLFTQGAKAIQINGLIWMGDEAFLQTQIEDKLAKGFKCIKLKIGSLDFEKEHRLLASLRSKFPADQLELRVDANGAYNPEEAPWVLEALADLQIHSIEQPIKAKQWSAMAELCAKNRLPIALDEELIGVVSTQEKKQLLDTIMPQYIILKPTLVGGFSGTSEWIDLAEERNIDWWITSALESNVGLNAIAQFTYQLLQSKNKPMPQGLGTGGLFTNNLPSNLELRGEHLFYKVSEHNNEYT